MSSNKRAFNNAWFYAVGVGRNPGVYRTWAEIAPLVNGIHNAKYRKFQTEEEAQQFVQLHASPQKAYTSPYKPVTPPVTPTHRNFASQQPVTPVTPTHRNFASQPAMNSGVTNAIAKARQMSLWSGNQATTSTQPAASSATLSQATQQSLPDEEEDYDEIFNLLDTEEAAFSAQPTLSQPSTSRAPVKPVTKEQMSSDADLKKQLEDLKNRLESIEESLHEVIGNKTIEIAKLKKDITALEMVIQNNKPELSHTLTRLKERDREREQVNPAKRAKLIDIDQGGSSSSKQEERNGKISFSFDREEYCIVYTDGACTNNGRNGAKAGIGVYFGDNHPLNVAEPLRGDCPPTNNNAEIQAASYALNVAKTAGIKKVSLHTDSQFTIDCITKWLPGWKKRGWKKADGKPVQNKAQLEILEQALEGLEVNWVHVRGHSNVHGNEMADKLANEGAARYGTHSP